MQAPGTAAPVLVRFSQAKPDPGGLVKRCQIDVGLRPVSVRAGDTHADLFAAVEHASDRVSRSLPERSSWSATAASADGRLAASGQDAVGLATSRATSLGRGSSIHTRRR